MARMIFEAEVAMGHNGLKGLVSTDGPTKREGKAFLSFDLLTAASSYPPAIKLTTQARWANDHWANVYRPDGTDYWSFYWSAYVATALPPPEQLVIYNETTGPVGSARMDGTWLVRIQDLGPRPDPPVGSWAVAYRDYQVEILLDSTPVLTTIAHWDTPPISAQAQLSQYWLPAGYWPIWAPRPYTDYLLMNPGTGLEQTTLKWQSDTGGVTRSSFRTWDWNTASELRDWTLLRGSYAGYDAEKKLQNPQGIPGELIGGALTRPPVTPDGWYYTSNGGWTYAIGGLQGGDCCGMWTDGMGVMWRVWWANGTISVQRLDNPSTDKWTSPVTVGEFDDCGGVAMSGDGSMMYVTVVEASSGAGIIEAAASYQWKSSDGGVSWEGPTGI